MVQQATPQAAIIGAGPIGLALALRLLQTTDFALTLFDAQPLGHADGDPRTIALSAGSQELLQSLGAWQHLAALATPIQQIFISQQSTPFASVHLTAARANVAALGYTCRYGDLVAALRAALDACGEVSTRLQCVYGEKITSVLSVSPHASAIVTKANNDTLTCDLALVAEGGLFGDQAVKPLRRDYAQHALIAAVSASRPQSGAAFERFTAGGPFALLPTAQGYSLVWCMPSALAAERQRLANEAPAEFNALLMSVFGKQMGELSVQGRAVAVALGLNAERSLVNGRVVRLGNAAQSLHPVAGQGFNLGLRDAWSLAAMLSVAQSDTAQPSQAPLDAALGRYATQRRLDRGAMIGGTDLLAQAFTWQLPGANLLRGAALTAINVLPPARTLLTRWMMRGVR
jgi:2-octaprenyl-6-methoxyphenol hydroxylase